MHRQVKIIRSQYLECCLNSGGSNWVLLYKMIIQAKTLNLGRKIALAVRFNFQFFIKNLQYYINDIPIYFIFYNLLFNQNCYFYSNKYHQYQY